MICKKFLRQLSNKRVFNQSQLQQFFQKNDQLTELDKRDLDLLAEEMTESNLGVKDQLYFNDWKNGSKTILISDYQTRKLWLWGALSVGSTVSYGNALIGGAATYIGLAAYPLVCLSSLHMFASNWMYNNSEFITKIDIHKDGKHLNIQTQTQFSTNNYENVKISDFLVETYTQNEEFLQKLQAFKSKNYGQFHGVTQFVLINGNQALLNFQYQSNKLVIDQVLKSQNVNTESL